jgi:hypothetical protein
MPLIPATQEAKMRRITVQGQSGQKCQQDPISINEVGIVGQVCHPNQARDIGRRIVVQRHTRAKSETLSKT